MTPNATRKRKSVDRHSGAAMVSDFYSTLKRLPRARCPHEAQTGSATDHATLRRSDWSRLTPAGQTHAPSFWKENSVAHRHISAAPSTTRRYEKAHIPCVFCARPCLPLVLYQPTNNPCEGSRCLCFRGEQKVGLHLKQGAYRLGTSRTCQSTTRPCFCFGSTSRSILTAPKPSPAQVARRYKTPRPSCRVSPNQSTK